MSDVSIFSTNTELQHHIWIGAGGAMLVLIQSILSGERRVWWKLLASCIIGGAAAVLAGSIFHDSSYVYAICGVAAIMAENIIFGLVNASTEFRQNPIRVFGQLWRVVMPTFGRGIDKPGEDYEGDGNGHSSGRSRRRGSSRPARHVDDDDMSNGEAVG